MPFGVIFAWDARRHAPAPSLINVNRPSRRVCRLQRRRSACRSSLSARLPGLPSRCRPTFSCDPEAHAVRERPSSASAHAPGGASLYNGEIARLLGLSSAGDVSVLGRPASVMRARRTACTHPSAAKPHTACYRLRIYMEGNARIYVNVQLPGPLSVHARAADLRRGRHERPASLPSLAFVVVSLAPLCICLHNAARRRDSSELGGTGGHWAGQGRFWAQF